MKIVRIERCLTGKGGHLGFIFHIYTEEVGVGVYSGGWRERQDAKGTQDSCRNAKRLVWPILRKIGGCEQFANVKDKSYSAVVYVGSSLKFQSFIFCSQIVRE